MGQGVGLLTVLANPADYAKCKQVEIKRVDYEIHCVSFIDWHSEASLGPYPSYQETRLGTDPHLKLHKNEEYIMNTWHDYFINIGPRRTANINIVTT